MRPVMQRAWTFMVMTCTRLMDGFITDLRIRMRLLTSEMVRETLTHSPTHSLTHLLTYSLTHLLLTHSLPLFPGGMFYRDHVDDYVSQRDQHYAAREFRDHEYGMRYYSGVMYYVSNFVYVDPHVLGSPTLVDVKYSLT